MSILDQIKRTRLAQPGETTDLPKPADPSTAAANGASAGGSTETPAPTMPTRRPAYGVQPAFETAGTDGLECTSVVNRTLRLQAERRDAHEDLKGRIHEDLINELDPEQLAGDNSFNSPIR